MKISNFSSLAASPERKAALTIAEAGLCAIDTRAVMEAAVRFDGDQLSVAGKVTSLASVHRIFLLAIGKCALDAAAAMEKILGAKLHEGIVVGVGASAPERFKKVNPVRNPRGVFESPRGLFPSGNPRPAERGGGIISNGIKVFLGTHPAPTEKNAAASRAIVDMLNGLRENDLVIVIVSGGGSTLLCLPPNGASCSQEAMILHQLFRAGAGIKEINTIRKHLSLARGGYLAKHAYPARVISLIFSDVPGNDLEFISSGPTVKDTTTVFQARALLQKYDILSASGVSDGGLIETPKEDKYFERVQNILLVSNTLALKAMAKKAEELGFTPTIVTDCLTGEARDAGCQIARDFNMAAPKSVRLFGGETTVTVKSQGQGGRNQELALGALEFMGDGEVILAMASDGRDNTNAAGAICDTMIKREALRLGLEPKTFLNSNDSYTFFAKTKGHLITGYTGSNVSDLLVALKT